MAKGNPKNRLNSPYEDLYATSDEQPAVRISPEVRPLHAGPARAMASTSRDEQPVAHTFPEIRPMHAEPAKALAGEPLPMSETALEPTDLTLRESIPVVMGFILVIPILLAPFLSSMYLRTSAGFKLSLIRRLVHSEAVTGFLQQAPWVEDAIVALGVLALLVVVSNLLGTPFFGNYAPLLKCKERMRARSGVALDFQIKDPGRPHRLALHPLGTFSGYPGEALISVKLQLPDSPTLEADRTCRPISGPSNARAVTDYTFDPIFFQFTPPQKGPAHMWISYGNGPECKLAIRVNRRA